ncbi:MAG: flagellin [Phycisphaeraceae bacterium]|nr:flagellin [Phycisphaeraceae bacterium]
MSRINTNFNSLIAQRVLGQNNASLTKSLERLSTGFKINRGGDDPGGLIASEKLRSEIRRIDAAIDNAQRADQIVNIAEGGIQEISTLLSEVQSLVSKTASDAGVSTEEKEANQQQVDQILQTIDRIAATTDFQGVKLLNGNFDFRLSTGSLNSVVQNYRINGAKFTDGSTQSVLATTTASAQHGALFLSGGNATHINGTASVTLEIGGADGTREFTFSSAQTLASIATAVNAFTGTTGVSATASNAGVHFRSDEFGSAQFVSINVISAGGSNSHIVESAATDEDDSSGTDHGVLTGISELIRDTGQDVTGQINGITARGKGKVLSINTDALALELQLTDAGATTNQAGITALTINGGGARFNLGPKINLTNNVQLGIQAVNARNLGTFTTKLDTLRSGGSQNLIDGSLQTAEEVVAGAIDQVSSLRGRLGAFQNLTVGSTIRALGVTFENVKAAESLIRDTDFAEETAALTRNQILTTAASNVLGISNAQPQSVLSLL